MPPTDGYITPELLEYMRSPDFRRDLDDFFRRNEKAFVAALEAEPLISKVEAFKPETYQEPMVFGFKAKDVL